MREKIKHKLILVFVLTISYNAYCQRNLLKIGDDLPLFNLLDHYGRNFNSHEFLQEKPMVIFFYPKNESKLCTKQLLYVKEKFDSFENKNVIIIAINPASVIYHRQFIIKNRFNFPILHDRDNLVQKMFGVPNKRRTKSPDRYTFIINKTGVIVNIIYDKENVNYHINQALITLNDL